MFCSARVVGLTDGCALQKEDVKPGSVVSALHNTVARAPAPWLAARWRTARWLPGGQCCSKLLLYHHHATDSIHHTYISLL